ncbi:hypothetical protein K503DRAFT_161127 [Rhizopogon vinicolor AM-OR11-026]|uniref:Uncharacterized protein n=1 Tax=Rhizopogon vinicolor AM-OR11-026 TaxID=1314800 RepID=A0A1B7N0N8_9AGAM|nr:hypothetical protein K503DRAFT_161127 [Rhizopogon vinicolor AM-OR11-026]
MQAKWPRFRNAIQHLRGTPPGDNAEKIFTTTTSTSHTWHGLFMTFLDIGSVTFAIHRARRSLPVIASIPRLNIFINAVQWTQFYCYIGGVSTKTTGCLYRTAASRLLHNKVSLFISAFFFLTVIYVAS